jgi:ribosomal-protein-alanine N-acetyltransferase
MTITSSRYLLRPMTVADIPRVSEVERESFPSMWPQTAYKRELQRNNLAAYLVLCQLAARAADARAEIAPRQTRRASGAAPAGGVWRLGQRLRELFARQDAPDVPLRPDLPERIVGFVGIWFMVDEAHIVTIAVAASDRRQGLGEALLIAAIELAQRRQQELVTLECRVSNTGAQALYEKYGFRRVGIRKRYYTDNNEDALIMTTPPIQSAEYKQRFEQLRAAHRAKHGAPRVEHPEL